MTSRQITKKLSALLNAEEISRLEISRDEVEVCVPDSNEEGRCDYDRSHSLAQKVASLLGFTELRSRGHGGWGVFAGTMEPMGDFNDRSSRWHY